jgi:hypothetical protein
MFWFITLPIIFAAVAIFMWRFERYCRMRRAYGAGARRNLRRHCDRPALDPPPYPYLRQMGLTDRLTRERPLNMSVAETASGEGTLARMIEVGRALKEEDGAGAIVMGCAGMARHRRPLEQALGIPVIDPTQAAVAMALGTVQFSRH